MPGQQQRGKAISVKQAKRKEKHKERKVKQKVRNEVLAASQRVVNAANKLQDPMLLLPPSMTSQRSREGFDVRFSVQRSSQLSSKLSDWCFQLTKKNMKLIYEESSDGWSDRSKREELTDEAAWILLVHPESDNIPAVANGELESDDKIHSNQPLQSQQICNGVIKADSLPNDADNSAVGENDQSENSADNEINQSENSADNEINQSENMTNGRDVICESDDVSDNMNQTEFGLTNQIPQPENNNNNSTILGDLQFSDVRRNNQLEGIDREPIAFAHFRFDMDADLEVLYCYELQVESSRQNLGIGRLIMQTLELISMYAKMKKCVLTVFKHNKGAVRFYREKLGYVIDDTSPSRSSEEVDYEILCKITDINLKRKIVRDKEVKELLSALQLSHGLNVQFIS